MTALKFIIDECLSPQLARRLVERGFDATSVRDRGRLADPDSAILEYCIREDRVLVTQNAEDFRKLVGSVEMHPGLIILSANAVETSWAELEAALAHVAQNAAEDARSWMFNRAVEVRGTKVTDSELPPVETSNTAPNTNGRN